MCQVTISQKININEVTSNVKFHSLKECHKNLSKIKDKKLMITSSPSMYRLCPFQTPCIQVLSVQVRLFRTPCIQKLQYQGNKYTHDNIKITATIPDSSQLYFYFLVSFWKDLDLHSPESPPKESGSLQNKTISCTAPGNDSLDVY